MRKRKQQGSAMVLAIIAFIILASIGAAFFSIALARERTTTKAASSDSALAIAEAGLDDAINKMTAYANYTGTVPSTVDFFVISQTVTLSDGSLVTRVSGTVNGGSYTVDISPNYTIKQTYKVTASASKGRESRAIEAYVSPSPDGPAFDYGLFGDVVVDAGGNVTSDSYLSSEGYKGKLQPDGYFYDRTNGSVGSNGDVEVGGKSQIFGNATPGPGGSFDDNGGAFVMGTTTPAASKQELYNVEYNADDVITTYSALPKKFPAGGVTWGTPGKETVMRFDTLNTQPGQTITVTGPVTIYVDNLIDLQGTIKVDAVSPNDGSVKIYHGQPSGTTPNSTKITVNAQSITGEAKPNLFQVYSATTGDITINGGAGVYAAVYAPKATYTNNGGSEVFGAIVAKTIKITGDATFHYDEEINLDLDSKIKYTLKSWKEYVP